jgi:hypothetical protein
MTGIVGRGIGPFVQPSTASVFRKKRRVCTSPEVGRAEISHEARN